MTKQLDNAGGELFAALAKAQASIQGAQKGNLNPHFKSKYADLASVWDACREALTSNGLSILQLTESDDPALVSVRTILGHESGQWVSSSLTMRPTKPDPQGIGSALTYARRYALAAMVGVAPEDDDGNAASRPTETITQEQAQNIRARLDAMGSDVAKFCQWAGVESIAQIPAPKMAAVVRKIEQAEKARDA
jgi:hypothetical protein